MGCLWKKAIFFIFALTALVLIPSSCCRNLGEADTEEPELVPIELELPEYVNTTTPRDIRVLREKVPHLVSNMKPPFIKVPKTAKVISRGSPVTSSDKEEPFEGTLEMLTDGDKCGFEGYSVILSDNPQWVQIDLGEAMRIDAVVLWHFFMRERVTNDLIAQLSDDPEFKTGVTTLFNNDVNNTSGQGKGNDKAYIGTYHGKQIPGGGKKARYVRTWSNGSTDSTMNEIIEAEVWGRPAE